MSATFWLDAIFAMNMSEQSYWRPLGRKTTSEKVWESVADTERPGASLSWLYVTLPRPGDDPDAVVVVASGKSHHQMHGILLLGPSIQKCVGTLESSFRKECVQYKSILGRGFVRISGGIWMPDAGS